MTPAPPLIYRLDDIEIDPSRASLVRAGIEQRVRPKSLAVLYYLLEHRHRIVTKEELLESIWPDTTVTEDTLTQCIGDLRRAMGDDSRNPRYLRTVPKQGFLFIGQVEVGQPAEARPVAALAPIDASLPPGTQPELPAASPVQPRSWRPWLATAVLGLLIAGASFWIWNSRDPVAASGARTSVAVVMFENRTARQDLDWMREGLPDMLIGSLARSSKLSLVPREQIQDLARRSTAANASRIDLEAALALSRKSHAQAVVMGAYTVMGEAIRVDLRILRARDGQLLGSEVLTVDRPADLLTKFEGLAIRAAAALQAPLPSNHPAAEARTANLEAYRLYTLGVERADHFHHVEAVALFQRALELDPDFHMAYARIGYVHAFSQGDGKAAMPYLEKALQRSARMNVRDRMFVEAWHAVASGNYEAAILSYQDIVRTYPDEISAYVALARLLRGERRLAEAGNVLRQAVAIDPDHADAHNILSGVQFELGHRDEALASAKRFTELVPNEPNSHDSLGLTYHRLGRYPEAMQSYRDALALRPDFDIALIHLGNTLVHVGRYRDAVARYRQFVQATKTKEQQRRGKEAIAWVLWKSGNPAAALRELDPEPSRLRSAIASRGVVVVPEQLVVLNGRGARASSRYDEVFLGLIALHSGNAGLAIQHMQAALRELPPYYMQSDFEDCLAETYLATGRIEEAVAEYRRVLGVYPDSALAQYGYALALSGKGDMELARYGMRRFLDLWKDADRDLPQVQYALKHLR